MSDDETIAPKVTGAPERIYINVGDIDEDCDFAELYELLWCTDKIDDADIAYVRADTVDTLIAAAIEAERATLAKHFDGFYFGPFENPATYIRARKGTSDGR